MSEEVIAKFEKIINNGEKLKIEMDKIPETEIYKYHIYVHCIFKFFNLLIKRFEKIKQKKGLDPLVLIDIFIKILKLFEVKIIKE
jgi:hypothetical protein